MAEPFLKKNKFGLISLFLSIFVCLVTILLNVDIAERYQNADGKTRALFGIVEFLNFSWKYYLLIPAITALILVFLSFKEKEKRVTSAVATVMTLIAIVFIILPIWKLIVGAKWSRTTWALRQPGDRISMFSSCNSDRAVVLWPWTKKLRPRRAVEQKFPAGAKPCTLGVSFHPSLWTLN